MAGGGGQVTAVEEKGVNKETAPTATVAAIHANQAETLVVVQ